jgi:hypothetical protein
MTTSRQRSRSSAKSASGRVSRRCQGSRSSSPPTTDWASDGVVHNPALCRHRLAQGGSPMLRSIRPKHAALAPERPADRIVNATRHTRGVIVSGGPGGTARGLRCTTLCRGVPEGSGPSVRSWCMMSSRSPGPREVLWRYKSQFSSPAFRPARG